MSSYYRVWKDTVCGAASETDQDTLGGIHVDARGLYYDRQVGVNLGDN